MSIVIINGTNPDSGSVSTKQTVDISFAESDVVASPLSESIKANPTATGNIIVIPRYDFNIAEGQVYYTSLYTERFNYQEWLSTINKNFVELS